MSRSPSPSARPSCRRRRPDAAAGAAIALAALLAACGPAEEARAPEPRPVRTVTVTTREAGDTVALTGRIAAQDVAALGFRIAGRVMERPVNVGDRVAAGQVLARLEPQNETNAVRAAQADRAAAQAALTQASNHFERQETLLAQGWTTRALFDQAKKERDTAQARLDSAEAQLKTADDLLGFTVLKADAPGVVTAVGAEPGEVVQAGQTVVRLARQGGRDAVFEVPAQVLRTAPPDAEIAVSLTDDPAVTATGRVREVAPEADPVTRTFEVKVGLADPPEAMRLGATVTGRLRLDAQAVIEIPASALTRADRAPAVWIVDPKTTTVALRTVEVVRFDPAKVAVAGGLDVGEIVVTAGVQALHPGQKVRLLGARP
ncbi:efflux RND transporter periplasmic adaptor subunit [Rhodoplanes sp. TEM]|uniref:Efflux RND transporter periplasmic adaptor subunit n=1 Tax=Rhodoplanes tepidamans TaxID=200616 RepID=A0ABT5J423_RHOTP|nr:MULTISPECIES: efflux RND transporter periplasmic adaptor subunit [Rhodoplanes]MDC7784393.1 efflux RND transporter periplasmic adaptor subunit [Rhodoplanes tepidamans]MDC7985172.1 efflux RND transporter periplasmic adaptor subunit [Rhodoplanes sp. TEM]MDQ0354478.1 RND family efflux transporter MFP subunit [Rhodoplanes tepidamans]